MKSPLDQLYPPLRKWFRQRFPRLTGIQRLALPHTLAGEHTLILAPTGSGKTLSAFLAGLSWLGAKAAKDGLPNAVQVVYVSPLRSLGRDIHRNLRDPLEAINANLASTRQVRMDVRTGDTGVSERGRMQRKRPHLLLTTPESLSALLSQVGWRDGFTPAVVIVDEIHAFAESKRGSLLALTLERLASRAPDDVLQRIGLSATAHPVEAVARLLCGERPCAVAQTDLRRAFSLSIALPTGSLLPAAGFHPLRIAYTAAPWVERAHTSLLFTSTRSATERVGLALKIVLPEYDEQIAIHHGSVDAATRAEIESGLASGALKAAVCSTSLELGVDFPAVDQVLLIGAPRGVSRTLQRLGRSGHRVDGVARGALLPLNVLDLMECVALREAASHGRLDPLRVPRAPLDVLAQVLLGMSLERPWGFDEAFSLVRRSGPYRDLSREQFDLVIEYLAGGGRVLGPYGTYGKIVVQKDCFQVASRKVAREYYFNIGTISDEFQVRVMLRGNRLLGSVEESFLGALQPEEAFAIGGKAVVLETLHATTALVRPAKGERVQTPRWSGNKLPLSPVLAEEELRLRRQLREAMQQGREAARRVLMEDWNCPAPATEAILRFLDRQLQAAPIPVDTPFQVEILPEGRSQVVIFHLVAGRAVNRSLGWVVGYRLGGNSSLLTNFDDHSFLLTFSAKQLPSEEQLRAAFHPSGMQGDLQRVVETTEVLGRGFRAVAEIGQLLPRRTAQGRIPPRTATWNGSLLYNTLLKYEPEHPLVREAVREVIEDQMDGEHARAEAARIHMAPWEVFRLPRPSPFALPLFVSSRREALLAQDPERALDELVESLYDQWQPEHEPVG